MAASLLAPLAFLAMAASAAAESAAHESGVVELRGGCQAMLTGLAATGMGETEVAMECRARLPPELCRSGLSELGAMPWTEGKITAACGEMTHDIELSIDALPRDMRDAAWDQMNAQVQKILQTKRDLSKNPIRVNGKPVTITIKGFKLDVTVILKFLETMRMTDMTNKYYTCQRTRCAPTTTPKPLDPLGLLFGAIKAESAKKSSPLHLPPLPPLKLPSKKYAEEDVSTSPRGGPPSASVWLSLAAGGSAMVAVAAFAASRVRKSRRALSNADESARTLSAGDDDAEDHE